MPIQDERDPAAESSVRYDTLQRPGLAARPPRTRRARAIAAAIALLIPLLGIAVLLMIFQPFADAAGGCGGG